ncbi:fasciclin-like arabinogalactan protein 4 [Beta vulgaris subsp. vulgaris]|uniref:fasciclin-like arabinogalactan protein 4 n=1 Tax=Beta vulgaris subsp. vulgaris TaxID=3555 RepID=UPI002037405E|nr:fasciclin-like arabinogalactan protein 4 [Beta vulgaris subsp. vulgaris]
MVSLPKIPYHTLTTFLYFFTFFLPIYTLNITHILSQYPDLSDFTSLLTTTGISSDLSHRTSLTILAVPNSFLHSHSPSTLADVIRYHILLQYLTFSDLRKTPLSGNLVTTLLQTTGRAPDNLGSLNVTFNPLNDVVSFHPPNNNSLSCNILSFVKTVPYNLSIFTVDSLLFPYGFDLMASETRPPPPGLNITRALIDGHDFNVAASMLLASGVIEEFEEDEGGAGITLFVPTDEAFANLPLNVQLQALPADQKALVLKFHVLHSYYPLGSLESIVNPVQPTLATEDNGAGSFTLNISRVNGSVAINTGIIQAVVTQTVFDQNPVAIFGVSGVLLPREIFGKGKEIEFKSGPYVGAQPPVIGPAPESFPDGYGGPSHLSAPPGFREGISSDGGRNLGCCWMMFCIALLCVFIL